MKTKSHAIFLLFVIASVGTMGAGNSQSGPASLGSSVVGEYISASVRLRSVDSIVIVSDNVDSLSLVVYASWPGCYRFHMDSILNEDFQDSTVFSLFYSEIEPACDCYCVEPAPVTIGKGFKRAIFDIYKRDFEVSKLNPSELILSEYRMYAKGSLTLMGVEKPESDQEEAVLYPNPAEDRLYVNCRSEDCVVQLSDMNGIVLVKQQLQNSEYIDISDLPSGLYILSVDGKASLKFNKQ